MPTPTFTTPPTAPSRTGPSFRSRMDNFLAWIAASWGELSAMVPWVTDRVAEVAGYSAQAGLSAANSFASASASASSANSAATQAALAAAALGNVNAAAGTWGTSNSNAGIGYTGIYYMTTEAGKAWQVGNVVVLESRSNPDGFVIGTVTGYGGALIAISPLLYGGRGTYSDWVIYLLGAVPPLRSAGRQLRINDAGTRMEWGDEGGRPITLRSTQNLLLYSKDFWQTGAWYQAGGSVGAVVTGPFGELNGYPVLATGPAPAYGRILQGGALPVAQASYTFSIYVKRGDVNNVGLDFITYGGGVPNASGQLSMDLSSGCVVSSTSEDGPVECGSEFAGNGWWRVWVVLAARPGHTTWVVYLYGQVFASTTGITHYSCAQLEVGRGPGPYVNTTSAAVTGQGALRRNVLVYSLEVDTAASGGSWLLGANSTRFGRVRSPRGDMTATGYVSAVVGYSYVAQAVSWAANTQYTISIYARLVAGSMPTTGTLIGADIDTNGNGTTAERVGLAIPGSGLSSEWKRFSFTLTNAAAISGSVYFAADYGNGAQIALWGAQVEIGPVATPHIPTASSYADGSSQTALLRRKHHVDTSKGPVTIACDVPLNDGDWFEVVDAAGAAATYNIYVLAGPVGQIAGDTADFIIDVDRWEGRFTYTREKGLVVS